MKFTPLATAPPSAEAAILSGRFRNAFIDKIYECFHYMAKFAHAALRHARHNTRLSSPLE